MANVFHFGATGDGRTDDTEALQHSLEAGDSVLELNKGTYRITQPLVLELAKQGYGGIRGNSGASRIVRDGPGPAIRVVGNHQGTAQPDTYQVQTWEKEPMPVFEGFEVLGNHPKAIGIQLQKTTKATISRILVRQCQYGIHLVERNRDFILSDSHLLHNHEFGLFLDRCNLHRSSCTEITSATTTKQASNRLMAMCITCRSPEMILNTTTIQELINPRMVNHEALKSGLRRLTGLSAK